MTNADLQEVADDTDSFTEVARATLRAQNATAMDGCANRNECGTGRAEPAAPKPVMVGRYRDLHPASLMTSLLDSAGIAGFLANDTMISQGVGGEGS